MIRSQSPIGLLLLLGMAGAGMSLFSDTVIGALPVLQATMAVGDHEAQQLVSLYVFAAAVMALFVGALSDAYGRRPLLLGSLVLLVLTSLGCVLSARIEQLWVLRAIQGATACVGLILSRTIVRDLMSGLQAQKMIGHISLIHSVIPVLTPLLGAWVAGRYGWRMVFICTGVLSLLMLLTIARALPESLSPHRRQRFRPAVLVQSYRKVLGSGVFMRVALAQGLNWAAAFLYIAAASKVITIHLGTAATEMYKLFAAIMLPMLLGFLLLPPLLRRYRPRAVLVGGYGIFAAAIALNLAVGALEVRSLSIALTPVALYCVGIGCTLPLLVGEALEPFPDNAGMASSCQMFLQYVLMGVTAGVLAPLAWDSLFDLAVAHAGMVSLGVVLLLWQKRVAQQGAVSRTTLRGS